MRACWLKWVGRDWSISADYIWLNYSGANKTAGWSFGHVVPVSTFAGGSHGEFNENTHAFYTKHAMASAKRVRKK